MVGVGNRDCGDDGIGPLVADRLAGRVPAGVQVRAQGGDMLALIEMWSGIDTVILIDAARTVTEAGRIHRLAPMLEPLPRELALGSTHAFGVADAVELARALDRLPRRLVVYAVEGTVFEVGAPPSAEAAAAIDAAVGLIATEVDALVTRQEEQAHA
ncbi:MAG TPA: hydrogenase maturation protease [Stellaceae bacterium]|nr:hydrogenase maturation protease [Stellaceae bacterium]